MAFYRLTKGTVSIIRQDADGIKEAEASGFVLDGTCDQDGNILSTSVVVETAAPKKTKAKE